MTPTRAISFTPPSRRLIDFHLKGVRLGDTEAHVIEKLGKPAKRNVRKHDVCGISQVLNLEYSGYEVKLDRGPEDDDRFWNVLEIVVTSAEVAIEPRVRIGATIGEIRSSLGDPWATERSGEQTNLYYLTRDNDNAEFEFKSNRLSKVRLFVEPC